MKSSYPKELITLITNLLLLHLDYEDIYLMVRDNFPNLKVGKSELLDIIEYIFIEKF